MQQPRDTQNKTLQTLLYRVELWFAPGLLIVPFLVSFLLIWDWYTRGFLLNSTKYNGELYLAFIIMVGNIIFDIPFIKTMLTHKKNKP